MKTIKTRFFAIAFLALGLTVGVTSCGDDGPEPDTTADFAGEYRGAYSILGLLEVEDTLYVENLEDNKISIFSVKLDTSFTATVSGNKATFDGFEASSFSAGSVTMTGIKVTSGTGTLSNNTDLNVRLTGVDVQNAEGETVPDVLKNLFPLKNQQITTGKTFKKQ